MAPPDGPGRTDQAIALLEKGLRPIPRAGSSRTTSGSSTTGTPATTPRRPTGSSGRRHCRMRRNGSGRWRRRRVRGGNREGARQMLVELASSSEEYIRNAAERGLTPAQGARCDRRAEPLHRSVSAARAAAIPTDWLELFPRAAVRRHRRAVRLRRRPRTPPSSRRRRRLRRCRCRSAEWRPSSSSVLRDRSA